MNAVVVRFVAGYGTARTDVPYTLTHAIKMLAAHLFNFREPIVEGSVSEIPPGLRTLFRIEGHGHLSSTGDRPISVAPSLALKVYRDAS